MTINRLLEHSIDGGHSQPILIIDDHTLFSTTLKIALASRGIAARQLTITGGITSILDQVGTGVPGLTLLDLHLGYTYNGRRIEGVELVAPLRTRGSTVLVVTDSDDLPRIAAAVAAGALGVVSKSGSFEVLLDTILAAAACKNVISAPAHHDLLALHHDFQARRRQLAQRLERLSPREREVLDLLAHGYRITAIAELFVVSRNTVRTQVRSILIKLDVNSQLEAAALLRDQQIVQDDTPAPPAEANGGQHCFQCGRNNATHWPWCPHYARQEHCNATVRREVEPAGSNQ